MQSKHKIIIDIDQYKRLLIHSERKVFMLLYYAPILQAKLNRLIIIQIKQDGLKAFSLTSLMFLMNFYHLLFSDT